jgi:GTPase SAR1 family protein
MCRQDKFNFALHEKWIHRLVCFLLDVQTRRQTLTHPWMLFCLADTRTATLKASFLSKRITDSKGNRITIDLWDTAGQERFAAIAPLYYKGTQ